MSIFRPPASHAEGHLKVTTIVVVINIYLYDYYYLTGHSEVSHGPLPSSFVPAEVQARQPCIIRPATRCGIRNGESLRG